MIGIFLVCFVVFPVAVFINSHKEYSSDEFLDRQDSDVVKGVATSFVILAHLTSYLGSIGESDKLLSVFTVMGGMGVLLFFFLSGYGLYKAYNGKQVGILFWKKRLIHMYFPCVLMQLVFCIIEIFKNQDFEIWKVIIASLFGAWFIDVILIQYLIFYITWFISKGKSRYWIILSFLFSIIVALIFWKLKFNARWYNGLMLFPFGMLMGYGEKRVIEPIKRQWSLHFILNALFFIFSGVIFATYKGTIAGIDIVKTFSGICLSMVVCIGFLRIKLCSKVMRYIGKRSLYFYLVHINLITLLGGIDGIDAIDVFFLVLLLSFPIVELFYQGIRKYSLFCQ